MAERRICTFELAGLRVGFDIGRVREVLTAPEVTPVPLAPPAVAGLINLRGRILTVVDARTQLSLAPTGDEPSATHVIVDHAGEAVSIVVDADGEVLDIDQAGIEPVPTTVSDSIRRCASGSYQLPAGLLVVLDVDVLLANR